MLQLAILWWLYWTSSEEWIDSANISIFCDICVERINFVLNAAVNQIFMLAILETHQFCPSHKMSTLLCVWCVRASACVWLCACVRSSCLCERARACVCVHVYHHFQNNITHTFKQTCKQKAKWKNWVFEEFHWSYQMFCKQINTYCQIYDR